MGKQLSVIRQKLQDAGYQEPSGITVDIDPGDFDYLQCSEAYDKQTGWLVYQGQTESPGVEAEPEPKATEKPKAKEKPTEPALECPYSEYGSKIGDDYDVHAECTECSIRKHCKQLSCTGVEQKQPASGYHYNVPFEFTDNIIRDNLTFGDVKILLRFMKYADFETGITWVSNKRITEEVKISQYTMARAMVKFKKLGYVVDKGKHASGTRYRVINLNP
jgi:hypothetical protein